MHNICFWVASSSIFPSTPLTQLDSHVPLSHAIPPPVCLFLPWMWMVPCPASSFFSHAMLSRDPPVPPYMQWYFPCQLASSSLHVYWIPNFSFTVGIIANLCFQPALLSPYVTLVHPDHPSCAILVTVFSAKDVSCTFSYSTSGPQWSWLPLQPHSLDLFYHHFLPGFSIHVIVFSLKNLTSNSLCPYGW